MNSQKKHFNLKNDSGSVTLFVLIAMIFFLIVCFFIYTNSNNKKVSQMKELEQLKKNYESSIDEIDDKYEDIISNEIIIEFSPNGGEYVMPTNGQAKISIKVNATSKKENDNIEKIYYQWTNSTEEPTNWTDTMSNGQMIEKDDCKIGQYYFWVKVIDNKGNEKIGMSQAFSIKEGKIQVTYNHSVTKGPLKVNLIFDSILSKNHKIGYGKTETLARNNIKNVTLTNNNAQIDVMENGFIYAEATDAVGNKVYITAEITNIDNIGPEINANPDGGEYELTYIEI